MNQLVYVLPLVLAFFSCLPNVTGSAVLKRKGPSFQGIVSFGNSYSDNGNDFHLTSGAWPADPAYFGGRFSNGPVWVEDLASQLGVQLNDLAFGGATSNNANVQGFTGSQSNIPVPSALDQLETYLSGVTGDISGTLFVIETGANDIFFDSNITAKEPLQSVMHIIGELEKHGANKFLVASYPDFDFMPQQAFNTPQFNQIYHKYSVSYAGELAELAASRKDVVYADVLSLFNSIVGNPQQFGFDPSVVGNACLTGVYFSEPRTLCNDPDKYVFFDAYHPTKKSHQLMAGIALDAIAKLPK